MLGCFVPINEAENGRQSGGALRMRENRDKQGYSETSRQILFNHRLRWLNNLFSCAESLHGCLSIRLLYDIR